MGGGTLAVKARAGVVAASAALPAATRAIGTRKGEQDTYFKPARSKKSLEFGSPPCSLQTPRLL